jgi:hypothetical protein
MQRTTFANRNGYSDAPTAFPDAVVVDCGDRAARANFNDKQIDPYEPGNG